MFETATALLFIKLYSLLLRRVALHPTSIPLRIFHACTLRLERLATPFCFVSSFIARKKGSIFFLLNEIDLKLNDTITQLIMLLVHLLSVGIAVI
jgi:hypothetical protein